MLDRLLTVNFNILSLSLKIVIGSYYNSWEDYKAQLLRFPIAGIWHPLYS